MTVVVLEIARLNPRHRVVALHDGANTEWAVQRLADGQWGNLSYASIRPSLLTIIKRYAGRVDADAQLILDQLPTHIGVW
jgi:hypothetical protein